MDVLADAFEDLQSHVSGYILSGLGVVLVVVPLLIVSMGLVIAGVVASLLSGAVLENDLVAGLGGVAVYGVLLFVILAISLVVTPPLQASVGRAILQRITADRELGFSDAFSSWRKDFGRVVGTYALVNLMIGTGVLFCYVPGLLMAFLLGFAIPAVVVHGLGPVEAVRLSMRHVLREPGWHLGYSLVAFGISMFLAYVPILGFALTVSFLQAFQLRCYVQIFGHDEHPRRLEF
jgi:uncharacterized membrane protein